MVAFSLAIAAGATATWLATAAVIAQTAVTIGSIAYQRNQQKKMKAKMAQAAEERKGFEVTRQAEAINLPVFYGYNKTGSLVTDVKVLDSFTYSGLGGANPSEIFPSENGYIYDNDNYIEITVEGYTKEGSGETEQVTQIIKHRVKVVSLGVEVYNSENLQNDVFGFITSLLFKRLAKNYDELYNDFYNVDTGDYLFIPGDEKTKTITENTVPTFVPSFTETRRYEYRRYPQAYTNYGTLTSKQNTTNAILMTQNAIAFEGINAVIDIDFDDTTQSNSKFKDRYRIGIYSDVPSKSSATFIDAGFPNTNNFTDTTLAECIFYLNRDDPQHNGIPSVSFYLQGQKIRDIIEITDPITQEKTYEFSTEKKFSNNPALILADYLTNTKYGRGLPDSRLDLKSFYKAKLICDTVVDNRSYGGKVFGGNQPRDIKLYEFNDVIDTGLEVRENVDKIIQSMQQAFLIWSGGKYKLQLSYPNEHPSVENELVHADHVFTDDDIIQSEINVEWPKAENKYNQVTVRFSNALKNFKTDSVTWPKSFSDVHNFFLEEDNQQPLKTETSLPGIIDPYHALARAEEMVRNSRTVSFMRVKLNRKAITLEPGDFFLLKSEIASISNNDTADNYEIFRVESITYDSELNCEITAYSFDYRNLAWNLADDVAYPLTTNQELVVPVPRNVEFNETEDGIYGVQSGIITWDPPLRNDFDSFVIEISTNAGSGTPTWTTLGETSGYSFDVIGLNSGTYSFQVKSKTNRGAKSEGILAIDPNTLSDEIVITRPLSLESLDGFNTATLRLYATSAVGEMPISFDGTATYNFETNELTGLTLGVWERNPIDIDQGEYLWTRTVFVKSRETTVEIPITEWSDMVIAAIGGRDGINSTPLFLYAKTSTTSPPALFSGTGTYDFNTDILSGMTLGVWSRDAPALDTNEYLWISQVIASSTTNEAIINISDWSTPVIRAFTGANGRNSITLSLYKLNDVPEKAWDLSGIVYNDSVLDVTNQQSSHRAIYFKPDGTKLYVGGLSTSLLDEYNLLTPWDVSSGVYSQSINLAETIEGMVFSPDGTKFFISRSNRVREYSLSIPWDISSIVYVRQDFFTSLVTGEIIKGIEFGDSGSVFYILAQTFIESYSLSTPYSTQNRTLLNRTVFPYSDAEDLKIKPTGDKLFVIDRSSGVYEYSLGSNWDISNLTLLHNEEVLDIITTGLAFKDDGTKLYVSSVDLSLNMFVREYSLNNPTLFTGNGSFNFETNTLSGITLNDWSRTFPSLEPGRYVWASQAVVISSENIVDVPIESWSSIFIATQAGVQGADGAAGADGVDGADGADGISSFLHVKYSNDGGITFTGNNGNDVGDWLGSYIDNNETASNTPSDYTWVKIKGEEGVSSYVHLKYSNDGGISFTSNNGDDPGEWLGSLVNSNPIASTNPADYTWVNIKGEAAADGLRGAGWFRYETGNSNSTSGLSTAAVDNFFSLGTGLPYAVTADRLILVNTLNEATGYILEDNATWNEQEAFIDGDLMVAGTITGEKLSANSVSALGLTIGTLSNGNPVGERIEISDSRIVIYDNSNDIRVVIGDLSGLGI